ncbi:hypothetical protein [Flavobacterium sp.]|uniref:hypothetical protein n=1 Tax=Flavobacterium sp. TaxID=239 RepID=UPI0035294705
MKALKTLNTIALLIPILLGFIGFFFEEYFLYAIVATMVTGFLQVVAGVIFWIMFPKNIEIQVYFMLVALFFITIFSGFNSDLIWILPPMLCVYLSIIIYKK